MEVPFSFLQYTSFPATGFEQNDGKRPEGVMLIRMIISRQSRDGETSLPDKMAIYITQASTSGAAAEKAVTNKKKKFKKCNTARDCQTETHILHGTAREIFYFVKTLIKKMSL